MTNTNTKATTWLASEAELEENVLCVVCPDCAFTFDAFHTDDRSDPPTYTCPACVRAGGVTGQGGTARE